MSWLTISGAPVVEVTGRYSDGRYSDAIPNKAQKEKIVQWKQDNITRTQSCINQSLQFNLGVFRILERGPSFLFLSPLLSLPLTPLRT